MDTRLASPSSLPSWQWYWSVQILATVQATTGRGTATTWPAADRAIFIPVMCSGYFTVKKFAIENGAVSGNLDAGIYTSEGKLVVSTGSTAMSGANSWQTIDVTDTQIPPGLYYLAMAINNTTGANAASAIGLQQWHHRRTLHHALPGLLRRLPTQHAIRLRSHRSSRATEDRSQAKARPLRPPGEAGHYHGFGYP